MDALEILIAEKRQTIAAVEAEISSHEAEITKLRESIVLARVELTAFEKAAQLRPLGQAQGSDEDSSDASNGSDGKRRGRQRGSISHAWRRALGYLNILGDRFDYDKMLLVAQNCGINSSLSSIRDRARDYVQQGLLEGSPEEGFLVTADAVSRFKLDQAPAAGHGGNAPEVEEIEEEEEDDDASDAVHQQGAAAGGSFFGDTEEAV
jgi:hypothetical protein